MSAFLLKIFCAGAELTPPVGFTVAQLRLRSLMFITAPSLCRLLSLGSSSNSLKRVGVVVLMCCEIPWRGLAAVPALVKGALFLCRGLRCGHFSAKLLIYYYKASINFTNNAPKIGLLLLVGTCFWSSVNGPLVGA